MTDKIAIGLAAVIIAFIGLDALLNEWRAFTFLAHQIIGLMQHIAFWR
jgi:nucleoside permease NupC